MTSDDRFDEVLGNMARDYQRPPETPREEMWARIEAARRVAPPRQAPGAVRVLPIGPRRRLAPWIATAVAASLVLGIGIGRISAPERDESAGGQRVAAAPPDDSTSPVTPARGTDSAPSDTPEPGLDEPTPAVAATAGGRARPTTSIASSNREPAVRAATTNEGTRVPYRVAAGEHLIRAEALLVSLRSDLRSGRRDSTIAVWAGDLLGTTRMLLDSPAGEDRQMKRLLEDLELVLAQIARLHQATGEAADLELIDEAVRQRQVMTRLRALSPGT